MLFENNCIWVDQTVRAQKEKCSFFFFLYFFIIIKQIATKVNILCRQFFPQCHDRRLQYMTGIQRIQQAPMEIDSRVLSINNKTLFESELCTKIIMRVLAGHCANSLPNDSTKLGELNYDIDTAFRFNAEVPCLQFR